MTSPSTFAQRIIRWQRSHGRHTLPWQKTRDPSRVWLAEIMLQQTQVPTVQRYYEPFLRRFPRVTDLAGASLDDVLGMWSGLGYYSRARNLHRCAIVVTQVCPRRAMSASCGRWRMRCCPGRASSPTAKA